MKSQLLLEADRNKVISVIDDLKSVKIEKEQYKDDPGLYLKIIFEQGPNNAFDN